MNDQDKKHKEAMYGTLESVTLQDMMLRITSQLVNAETAIANARKHLKLHEDEEGDEARVCREDILRQLANFRNGAMTHLGHIMIGKAAEGVIRKLDQQNEVLHRIAVALETKAKDITS